MPHVAKESLDGRPRAGKEYKVEKLYSGHAHIRDYIVLWHFRQSAPFKISYGDHTMTVDPRKTSLRDIKRLIHKDAHGFPMFTMYHFKFIPDDWNMTQGELL